jgi:hypothetical protein
MPSGGPIYGRSVIEYRQWRISVADFVLSDIINIGRYGGFFRHNLLLRHHQLYLGGCPYTILEFGIRPNSTLQNRLVRWRLPTNVRLITQWCSQWSSYSFSICHCMWFCGTVLFDPLRITNIALCWSQMEYLFILFSYLLKISKIDLCG